MKLILQSLSKSYGDRELFNRLHAEISPGMRLGVAGPNGSGKTTLFRIILDQEHPDAGEVIIQGAGRIGYVSQEIGQTDLALPLLSYVLDAVPSWAALWREWENCSGDRRAMERLSRKQEEMERDFGYNPEFLAQSILQGLGFPAEWQERTIQALSGGWRERAKLARAMLAGRDILLLDEPTNHLDLEAVLWMERYLAGFGGILLFTAHDRCFLDRVATHVLSLGDDTPHLWKGSFSGFEVWREEKKKLRQREAERIEEEINRKQAFVDRFRYKATKASQAQSRVLQIDKLRKELLLVAPGREQRNLSFSWPTPEDSGKKVISLVDLGYSFSDGTILWKDVNCSIPKGRKIALLGPNGKGKSTLMKTIAGRAEASSGHIEFGPRTVTGYFSQHQSETLNLENSVLTEIRRLSHPHTTEEELRSVLGLFLLPEPFWDRKTADLSGGEKNKLVLASLFLTRANFLLLDEPTNHLDLESREALCAALSAFQGAVLLISHDRHLLSRVAQELWVIKDKSMSLLDCSIENYLKELEEQADRSARLSKPSRGKKTGTREDTRKYEAEVRNRFYRKLKPLQAEYAELEMRLDSTLSEQESREFLLADPKVYNDPHRLAELNREYSSIQEEGEGLMNRLSELEEKIRHVEAERDSLLGLSPS